MSFLSRRTAGMLLLAALIALGFFNSQAAAQSQQPDFREVVLDFMRMSNANGEVNLVFWIPDEFWRLAAALNPNASTSQTDVVIKVVHPYTILCVASGKNRPFAAPDYRTEAEVRGLIRLKDGSGNIYTPLPQDQLDASVAGLLAIAKPSLERMSGSATSKWYFFVFPGSTKDGMRICDPTKEGTCEVDLGEQAFRWRLPLGSLLPKQRCPRCGEMLSGAYKFCPYDGTKLEQNK